MNNSFARSNNSKLYFFILWLYLRYTYTKAKRKIPRDKIWP